MMYRGNRLAFSRMEIASIRKAVYETYEWNLEAYEFDPQRALDETILGIRIVYCRNRKEAGASSYRFVRHVVEMRETFYEIYEKNKHQINEKTFLKTLLTNLTVRCLMDEGEYLKEEAGEETQ